MTKRYCLDCEEELLGRLDQKFCSDHCRSAYHYRQNKQKEAGLFKLIDQQLKLNRRILKNYNKAGKATVRKSVLLQEGFNPKYYTHLWRARNKNGYYFCYEYGFMEKKENGRFKYVLVQWQPYMGK